MLSEIEFWIRQFRPVRRQFQVKVDGAVFQFGSYRKGQRGFADLARPEKPDRGKSVKRSLITGLIARSIILCNYAMQWHNYKVHLRQTMQRVLILPSVPTIG